MKRAALVLTVALACVTSRAPAHDTWILPRVQHAAEKAEIVCDVTSGMAFPALEHGPKADRIARGGWRLGSEGADFSARDESDSTLAVRVLPRGSGTAVVWASFGPREIDLTHDDVEHYFEEIGATDTVRRAWADMGPEATFHEVYTKHAKSYVRVGEGAADATCTAPLGQALELVPAVDPTTLAAGDTLAVRAQRADGTPLFAFAVGAVSGGDSTGTLTLTDADGVARIAIHRDGPWLVRATELRHTADGTWESDFATLTFFAGARASSPGGPRR